MGSRSPLNVLMILEATVGGTRRHLLDLVTHLDRSRFRVSVLASAERDPAFRADLERLRRAGFAAEEIPMVRAVRPWRDLVAWLRIGRHLSRHAYAIVHTHSSKAGFLGRWAAWRRRVPVRIHTPHGFAFDMDIPAPLREFYALLEKMSGRITTRLVCVSRAERDAALARRLLPPDRVVIIPNGVAVPADFPDRATSRRNLSRTWGVKLNPSDPLVGSVGRLERQKGYEDFIAAAGLLKKRFPSARFLIVGEGSEQNKLAAWIDFHSLRETFIVLDDPAAIPSAYGAMDVFVSSSLWEGLPYTLLDAMAAGKPVVATRVGGVPDGVREGVNGRLVPPRDGAALAEAIAALLADPRARERMGVEARRIVETEFRLDTMIRRTEELYEACAAAAGLTSGSAT